MYAKLHSKQSEMDEITLKAAQGQSTIMLLLRQYITFCNL